MIPPAEPADSYLARHTQADRCLDPVARNGMITYCWAVPVVELWYTRIVLKHQVFLSFN